MRIQCQYNQPYARNLVNLPNVFGNASHGKTLISGFRYTSRERMVSEH